MLQSFDETARPEQGPARLARLRTAMASEGVDAYLIPRADAHQGEYVAPADERLAWLTGFTGSAGFCIATAEKAGVFIDGRYRVQVKAQVDLEHFTPVHWPETRAADWLGQALPQGGIVGFDPWLHTPKEISGLCEALEGSGITLRETPDLVGSIWEQRPAPPMGPVSIYPEKYAGKSHAEKRAEIAQALRDAEQRHAVITLPDSLCWLLNIRGSDVPRTPVLHAFAILSDTGAVRLFVEGKKLDADIRAHLGTDVTIEPPDSFGPALRGLAGSVRVDQASAPLWVVNQLEQGDATVDWGDDPCILPKACKNPTEIAASREAHKRDAAALCRFLAWYDQQAPGTISEIDVVTQLETCRRETGALRDISFDTIAGSGPNGALAHYRVTKSSDRTLQDGDLLVLDGGGQYEDGTTDITRTLPIGTVGKEERAAFTRVLQGMIALSRARWPKGLAGRDLDPLARYPLWLADQDYNHGTGHGVGLFLSVHEGPQRISRQSEVPLQPGMILSNEPGYYREGAFGIRIENLMVVTEAELLEGGDFSGKLCFETLSYVPIDRRLIDVSLLSTPERAWLDHYHGECMTRIGPLLEADTREWLADKTRPL